MTCCTAKRMNVCSVILVITGGMWLLLATFVPPAVEKVLQDGLDEQLHFRPDNTGDVFRWWKDSNEPGAPVATVSFNIMNITNADAWLSGEAKPMLEEVGPFVYRKHTVRFNLTFDTDFFGKKVLHYSQQIYYVFQPDLSVATDDKLVRAVNVPFLGFATALLLQGQGAAVQAIFGSRTEVDRLTDVRSAREWIFGYTSWFGAAHPGVVINHTTPEQGEAEGRSTLFTGEGDIGLTRMIHQYRGATEVQTSIALLPPTIPNQTWNTLEANRVMGTDGYCYPRDISKGSSVTAWAGDDLSRSMPLINRDSETITVQGVELLRFTFSEQSRENSTTYPPNAAFNQFGPSGFYNLTRPRQGVAVFISSHHFLGADPRVLANFDGLNPDPAIHELYVGIEPITGNTLDAHKRAQVNFQVTPLHLVAMGVNGTEENITWFSNVKDHTYMPLAMIDEAGTLSEDQASLFKGQVYFAQTVKDVALYGGVTLAVISLAMASLFFCLSLSMRTREVEVDTGLNDPLLRDSRGSRGYRGKQ